jgi:hypothetical protein
MRIAMTTMLRPALLVWLTACCGSVNGAPSGDSGRLTELTSIDLEYDWQSTSDSNFPISAFKAFPGEDRRDAFAGSLNFLRVDLDGDGRHEIIVASRASSGSGGQGYFILRERGTTWKLIGELQGGFVLSLLDSPTGFYRITSYYRSGDTYQNTYTYLNGRYRLTGQVRLPRVVSYSCWWHPFWMRLNGFSSGKGRAGEYDSSHQSSSACTEAPLRR